MNRPTVKENKKHEKWGSVMRNKGVAKINDMRDFNNSKNAGQMEVRPSGAHGLKKLDGYVKGSISGLNGSKLVGQEDTTFITIEKKSILSNN